MTTIKADIVADSISPYGKRITTFSLTYPRWIHAEVMTHRALAKNASSSRAIPINRLIRDVETDPAIPLHIGQNQRGMQAYRQVTSLSHRNAVRSLWREAMRASIKAASDMHGLFDVAKQVANRLIENHGHINVVVTATEWENFFALRCHPMAEPHMRALAWLIADAYYTNTPTPLGPSESGGTWHLPYVKHEDRAEGHDDGVLLKISAARCARVSYANHEGKRPSLDEDMALFSRLVAGLLGPDPMEPGHLSPLEHQAAVAGADERSGPFIGWVQHRKLYTRENMTFDYQAALERGWRQDAYEIFADDDGEIQ